MIFHLAGIALGIVVGFVSGGRLSALAPSIRLRFVWLLVVALGAQFVIGYVHVAWLNEQAQIVLLLLSYLAMLLWLGLQSVSNRGALRVAFAIAAAGTLLNFLSIAPNRGIPVSARAARIAGTPLPAPGTANRFSVKHVVASKRTVLNPLGDVIPVPLFGDVISIGDLLIVLGIASIIVAGMRGVASAAPVEEGIHVSDEEIRRPGQSSVVLSQAMSISDANLSGNVHGGVIMKLVDTAAGLSAIKHARGRVVTVSMDEMSFLEPVFLTDLVTLSAQVNDVGRTSMEIGVRVVAENTVTGEFRHVSSAYLVFVGLDDAGRPRPVPRLEPETEEERRRMEDAKVRRRHRIARKEALQQLRVPVQKVSAAPPVPPAP